MPGAGVLPVGQVGQVVVAQHQLTHPAPDVVSADHPLHVLHGQQVGRVEPAHQRRQPVTLSGR
jgi:hypothetical protein